MALDLLPSSAPREIRGRVFRAGRAWVPLYCASCSKPGPYAPEAAVLDKAFHFYLCDDCYAAHGAIAGTMAVPDEVLWETAKQEQLERYGRLLTGPELAEALKDEHHPLTKLARDHRTR